MLENGIRVELDYWQAEWQRDQTNNAIPVTKRERAALTETLKSDRQDTGNECTEWFQAWSRDLQTKKHTFAGILHMFEFIWKPQNCFMVLFTLFSQEMKKCCIVTDGFCVSEL